MGELVSALERHGSGRNAVALLTSDHGESMGEGGYWFLHGHATTPDVAHVPLILRAPGIAPGRRPEPVSHVDVMPTLLELAGLEPPPGLRGVALGPFLRGGTAIPARWLYCDLGSAVAAYDADGFVLGRNLPSPARPGRIATWSRHAWTPGTGSLLLDRGIRPDAAIERYVAQRPEEQRLELDEASQRQLRALGYLAE